MLGSHLHIGVIATGVDQPLFQRSPYGTTRLMYMGATRKAASAEVWTHLREQLRQLLDTQIPGRQLAQSRRIGQITADIKGNQLSSCSGMPALACRGADRAH